MAEETLGPCIWQQQRQLGALPAFTLVKGTLAEEPGGGGEAEAEAAQERALLRYSTQEPVNTGNAAEGAGWQRRGQAQRGVPASRAALRHWVKGAA